MIKYMNTKFITLKEIKHLTNENKYKFLDQIDLHVRDAAKNGKTSYEYKFSSYNVYDHLENYLSYSWIEGCERQITDESLTGIFIGGLVWYKEITGINVTLTTDTNLNGETVWKFKCDWS